MRMPVLLMDVGAAGSPPSTSPVIPVLASWLPVVALAVGVQPPDGVTATPVADGALLKWAPVGPGESILIVVYVNDEWVPVAEVADSTQYMVSMPTGGVGIKMMRAKNGITSEPILLGLISPISITQTTQDLLEQVTHNALEIADVVDGLAAETSTRAQQVQQQHLALLAAQQRVDDVLSDSIITPDEKPQLIVDYNTLINERPGILQQASASGVDATAYNDSINSLVVYMAQLTSPVGWDDTSGNTNIV